VRGESTERSEIALVVQRARIRHAKSVATLPDGEIDDLDHLGHTLDQAIADAVLAMPEMQAINRYLREALQGGGAGYAHLLTESVIDWALGGPS